MDRSLPLVKKLTLLPIKSPSMENLFGEVWDMPGASTQLSRNSERVYRHATNAYSQYGTHLFFLFYLQQIYSNWDLFFYFFSPSRFLSTKNKSQFPPIFEIAARAPSTAGQPYKLRSGKGLSGGRFSGKCICGLCYINRRICRSFSGKKVGEIQT